jgi:hypothetical protein
VQAAVVAETTHPHQAQAVREAAVKATRAARLAGQERSIRAAVVAQEQQQQVAAAQAVPASSSSKCHRLFMQHSQAA